jgi:hypothetical protein
VRLEELSPYILNKIRDGDAILFLGAGATIGAKGNHGEEPLDGDQLRDAIAERFLGGAQKKKPLAFVSDIAKNEAGLVEVQHYVRCVIRTLHPLRCTRRRSIAHGN